MSFLCGTYFKRKCHHQFTDYIDARNPKFCTFYSKDVKNNYVFCKPEFLETLQVYTGIGVIDLPNSLKLVTHNSDINFNKKEIDYVLNLFPQIDIWYTQNLICEHPKVKPIPIGIANPKWSHGNQDRFLKIIKQKNKKNNLFYANFNVSTNPLERTNCYKQIGIDPNLNYPNAASIEDHNNFVNKTQEEYLNSISRSFFTVSPDGNGKDCHKTWEALYMKSIPIVTRWHGAEKFKDLGIPIIIIDDWSQFKDLNLSSSLYEKIWGDFDPFSLNFDFFK